MKDHLHNTAKKQETCILVGVITDSQTAQQAEEYLDELAFLAETAGAITHKRFLQRLSRPDSRTFIGTGKLEEVVFYVQANNIDLVIFDDELSPTQIRNIEQQLNPNPYEIKTKLLDRSTLILDIFASRARTAQAKTQVELAQHRYLLPRLTRMWTHLSKQKGGIGMKGPGEKEIETDRRIIRYRISLLEDKLIEIDKQNTTQRKTRGQVIRVALVGYTNVGKSTIMNLLSKSDLFAENKLFATLDSTTRKVVIEQVPFLLSDTVGFIRKLPHHLVESFKSTLDETREADLLLHVVDISHPNFEEQMQVVNETLKSIAVGEKPILVVFNKIDQLPIEPADKPDYAFIPGQEIRTLEKLSHTWMSKLPHVIFVSAYKKQNIDRFREVLIKMVKEQYEIRYPYHAHFFGNQTD